MPLLKVQIRETDKSQLTPARVILRDEKGKYYYPEKCFSYKNDNHFTTDGQFKIMLPVCKVYLLVEKGKEYMPVEGELDLEKGQDYHVDCELQRWINMAELGWYSGDLHIHRTISEIKNLILAEDLNIAPNITVWNDWKYSSDDIKIVPKNRIIQADSIHVASILTQEDERQGGAVILLNLDAPIELGLKSNWYPAGYEYCRNAHNLGCLVDQEKPFWWEAPVNVALGGVDTIGIINNHIQREEIMDNEAWGKPRDLQKFPNYRGFIDNVLDQYYHYLNLGMNLPISAGSASGVLKNPVGFNRLYVHLDEGFSYDKWFIGMKLGRSFATNGPLLFFSINGQESGSVIKSTEPILANISIKALSQNQLENIQIIYNGQIIQEFGKNGLHEFDFLLNESGWIIARAFEKPQKTIKFAHTSPIYVEIGSPMKPNRDSAMYYANWCKELLEMSKSDKDRYITNVQREEVESLYRRAITFYEKML
jgi:hypothetical protein